MTDLYEFIDHQHSLDRDTTIVVRGNPEREHVRSVVDHIGNKIGAVQHVLERDDLERVEEIFKSAEDGDTLILYLGEVYDHHPEILTRIEASKARGRWKRLTWVFVTQDAPGDAIEHYSDIEVVPRVVAEVNRFQRDDIQSETYRVQLDPVSPKRAKDGCQ